MGFGVNCSPEDSTDNHEILQASRVIYGTGTWKSKQKKATLKIGYKT